MILDKPEDEQRHMSRVWAYYQRKRAERAGHPANVKPADWLYVLALWDERCAYCGQQIEPLTCDHFIPLSDPASPGSTIANVLPACESCNVTKDNHDPFLWLLEQHGPDHAPRVIAHIVGRLIEARNWKMDKRRQRREAKRQRKASNLEQ